MARPKYSYRDVTVDSLFDQWRVLKKPILHKSHYRAKCECSCGTVKLVKTFNLLKGLSKSCGCIQRNNLIKISKGKTAWNVVSPEHKAITELINQYKHGAKIRGLDYSLTREQFESLIKQKCFYCSSPPSNNKATKNTTFTYSGIDRFDNLMGYIFDNCRTCCYTCNVMKLDMSAQSFVEHINKIVKNNSMAIKISEKKLINYHNRAIVIASQSHDIHTKVAALLIDHKTGAVTAEGYNGFVRGGPDSILPTSRPKKYDYMIHAETNLLCNSVRSGVKTNDGIVYCTLSPCTHCLRMLWQAGISEYYFKDKYKDFKNCTSMLDLDVQIESIGAFYHLTIKPRT